MKCGRGDGVDGEKEGGVQGVCLACTSRSKRGCVGRAVAVGFAKVVAIVSIVSLGRGS